jgi:hypothetical protein
MNIDTVNAIKEYLPEKTTTELIQTAELIAKAKPSSVMSIAPNVYGIKTKEGKYLIGRAI